MNSPLRDIPEKELKSELQRRKDDEKRAYKEWMLSTRPKRARFVRHFTLSRDPPVLMIVGPVVAASVIGAILPNIERIAMHVGMYTTIFFFLLCFIGSFIEASCEGAFRKTYFDAQKKDS